MMQSELFTRKQKKEKNYNSSNNKLNQSDRPFHDWYRFVLSFPPLNVRSNCSTICGYESDCFIFL